MWIKNRKDMFSEPRRCISMQSTVFFSLINLFIYLSIYLFLAVLGLRCCVQALSSCGERGLLFVVVRGLLIVVASFVAEHGI